MSTIITNQPRRRSSTINNGKKLPSLLPALDNFSQQQGYYQQQQQQQLQQQRQQQGRSMSMGTIELPPLRDLFNTTGQGYILPPLISSSQGSSHSSVFSSSPSSPVSIPSSSNSSSSAPSTNSVVAPNNFVNINYPEKKQEDSFFNTIQNLKFSNENTSVMMDFTKQQIKKRRQRTGPSCDSCRVRKVKCDAETIVVKEFGGSKKLKELEKPTEVLKHFRPEDYGLSNAKLDEIYKQYYLNYAPPVILNNNNEIQQEAQNYVFLKTPTKIIRFRKCSACLGRHTKCTFSKGFTRPDILKYNKLKKMSD